MDKSIKDQFVIECTKLLDLRNVYIDNYYWERPCMFIFIALMTIENETVVRKVSANKTFLSKFACTIMLHVELEY